MPTTLLGRRLILMAAAALLPLALMSALALQVVLNQQRRQTEQAALDLTRALATAVDNELRLTVSALEALAVTEPMRQASTGTLAPALDLAERALASRPEWLAVLLLSPQGDVLFNTGMAEVARMPRASEPASLARVVRSGQPTIGSLAPGPRGTLGVPVRVPVLHEGQLRAVLTAVIRPEAILSVVSRQRVPGDWIVSVFDDNRQRVARSREHQRYVGTPPSESLLSLMAQQGDRQQLFGLTSTLDGDDVHTALARVDNAHWTVALGVPVSVTKHATRDSIVTYGGGLLLSLAVGSLAAWLVWRSIGRPVSRLRDAALALGRGEPVLPARSDLAEIEAVSDALMASAARRALNEAERESLLNSERSARTAAEHAQQRLALLAGASTVLSQSLQEESTLAAIAQLIVPHVADLCRIDLLDAQGVLQRKLTHHADPQRRQQIEAFVSQGRVSPETPGSFPWAMATGKTYIANYGSEPPPLADETFREFMRVVGMRAVCVVPLVARGRTLGALAAIQAESGRQLNEEDGALITELAQRAAMALDNVRLFEESRQALRQAQAASRSKDEFLAMLGHELRNPLAPIVTALEILARRDSSAGLRERRIIERQVKHLLRLVDDLLDVSRIASGKVVLAMDRVDLRDVVHRALEQIEPALQGRAPPQLALPEAPVFVKGDFLRLAQVVCNLLVNAAKFTPADRRIGVELQCSEAQAELAVVDEGIGIPADLLPHVFERFVQGDQALNRASGGLGLGLAIAQNLVQLHGGSLTAHSDGPQRGSRFSMRLPLDLDVPLASEAPAPVSAVASRQARILIVDDNEDAATALAMLLQLQGHELRTAHQGEAALALLESFTPELALLDIGLPGMDGYQLARALRADPRCSNIRLVALTGYGLEADKRRALEAGFDQHLVKPVDLDLLLRTLEQLL